MRHQSLDHTQDAQIHPRFRRPLLLLLPLVAAIAVGAWLGGRALYAQATYPSVQVNPPGIVQILGKTSPITISVNASNLSGPGNTPVAAYQYALQWNPNVLQYVSGPNAGPGVPTPLVVPFPTPLSAATPYRVLCASSDAVTATATPTGVLPFTATWTSSPTPTNTFPAGTPTYTPTITQTPTVTPTPSGYIAVGCASLPGAQTPIPSGVVGVYTFNVIATGTAVSPLNLVQVGANDASGLAIGTPIVTPQSWTPTAGSSVYWLQPCYDVDGSGVVDIQDLSDVAGEFLTLQGHPGYTAAYDVDHDGVIDLNDISLVASEFLLFC